MIGTLGGAVLVISTDAIVSGVGGSAPPMTWLEPSVNRGGIARESGGVWSVAAPRSGLYRVAIARVQATGYADAGGGELGAPALGEWYAGVGFGDAFVNLRWPPFGLPDTSGYLYVEGSASTVMQLNAGDVLEAQLNPPDTDDHDPGVELIQAFGTFTVELLRRL